LFLKSLYHRWVPARLRYPLGRGRRFLLDTGSRWLAAGPLPPRGLLRSVQMTPYIGEYLEVGRKSAASIGAALAAGGLGPGARVLDFGCGLARTLRFLRGAGFELKGCDVDAAAIGWSAAAFPEIGFAVNRPEPPLPYGDAAFEAIYAVSVFTHFGRPSQEAWMREMARCLADHGLLLVTTMGRHALGGFPNLATAERRAELDDAGFVFVPGGERFNDNGAFHTAAGLARLAGPELELEAWTSGGLDGFQDLAVLRRLPRPSSPAN
jgi:SAM-dependent methyltransferase